MNSNLRVKKVFETEYTMIVYLMNQLMESLKNDPGVCQMLKNVAGVEVSKNDSNIKFVKMLDDSMFLLRQKGNYYGDLINKLNNRNNQQMIVKDDSGRVLSNDEIETELQSAYNNFGILKMVFDFREYDIKIAQFLQSLMNIDDPVVLFKRINRANKQIIDLAKNIELFHTKENFYEKIKAVVDYYLNEEFYETFSMDKLKEEIEQEKLLQIKEKKVAEKPKVSHVDLANDGYALIKKDLLNLNDIDLFLEDKEFIYERKSQLDSLTKFPITKVDESKDYENISFRVMDIIISLEILKKDIANVLRYSNEDIKDILREKHSYQIRDYVENLKLMSDKLQKMLNEFDEMDSSQLLAAYKKVLAMYEVVEEMKANSFVVDISRFSK